STRSSTERSLRRSPCHANSGESVCARDRGTPAELLGARNGQRVRIRVRVAYHAGARRCAKHTIDEATIHHVAVIRIEDDRKQRVLLPHTSVDLLLCSM